MLLVCALALLCGVNAVPTIAPAGIDCGNGIFCASGQTCLSNATGAGQLVTRSNSFSPTTSSHFLSQMACSPFSDAVFCHDARFSCPAASTCSDAGSQVSRCFASDGSVISRAAKNVDAMKVAEFRNYGV